MENNNESVTTDEMTDDLVRQIEGSIPEMESVEAGEAEALIALIARVRPIMRLIDRPILESEGYYIGRSGGSDESEVVLGRGIILRDVDWGTTCEDGGRYNYTGERLLLMRDGSLKVQTRSRGGTRWQGEGGGWSSEVRDVSPSEAMEWGWEQNDIPGDSTPLEKFAGRVRRAMREAMDASSGKIGQLRRRREVIDRILVE